MFFYIQKNYLLCFTLINKFFTIIGKIYFNNKIITMSSKSPIKDYSRLLGVERTTKKEENFSRIRQYEFVDRIADETKTKLELSLKHNAKLLDENAALSELASRLRYEIKELNERLTLLSNAETANIAKVQNERAALMDELQVKQFNHEQELKRLLDEISRLHEEKNDLEMIKNKEMELFKQEHEKNMTGVIQSIRSTHDNSKDLYEMQVRKLRETIDRQEKEIESAKAEHKLQNGRLQDSVNRLESELKHQNRLHEIELKDIKNSFQTDLKKERRILERENEIASSNQELALKKLKYEVQEKNQEINAISKKMANNENMHSIDLESLKREKEELLSEIATAEVTHANTMLKEKAKLKQINEQEIQNILSLNEVHIG